jgi:hypothetical protein
MRCNARLSRPEIITLAICCDHAHIDDMPIALRLDFVAVIAAFVFITAILLGAF